ncbi:MAG: FtsW/RodA/SpoVE family cell cycle protein [Planctomycetota bacterium]|jgi:cell division protein FtsW
MLRAGHGIVLIVCALLAIGVVMVTSAGLTIDADRSVSLPQILLGRPALLAALAVGALLVGSRVPVQRLRDLRVPALRLGRVQTPTSPMPWIAAAMVILLLAVYVPGIGREVNGARRWIDLGFTTFQPSEFAKWGMLVVLAAYAARRAEVMGRLVPGLLVPMTLVALVCGLIITEDLGTAVLIGTVSATVLLAAGARLWHATLLSVPAVLVLVAATVSSPYRLDRWRAWLDPYQDPQGIGYHVIQSMTTVAGGGLAGRGLGNGVQKFGYLPEDTTDFIFAVICEEMGLVGATVVVSLFGGLLLCGWSIIRRCDDPFRRLLGLGILLTLGLQALINMAVVTGLAPTKGIALPLVSAGGTGWVLTAFSLGLLVSMGREAEPVGDQRVPAACVCR